ncbi:uncharacterized protein LOC129581342 [Paramacrobiotus metropolitanus]|uniref:uncharacterized protein LOC129581342 n=1 Tax=Paramacrobiotus metropolitanus TaxID=2943436 RepID=UPI0024464488|nr:uncharacterized protein LOC129581342 [Paramacrobiotus metropolitanus]XP_055328320.1 uncharacterized protein LOC129581342 [Paramacrobiotus metropolitanus]
MHLGSVLMRPMVETGYARRIAKLVRIINLKPVDELHFQFDPFFDGKVESIREALRQVSAEKIQRSNPRIDIKTTIVDDRSQPFMRAKFADGGIYKIKTANLTGVQILEQLDRLILQREPRTWEQTRLPRSRGK